MARQATITVDWPIANLQAKIDVEAPELRTSFSISIEGLVEDTLDGGYPYIPSSDTSALYKIDLTDNLGTTDAEWVEKYNAGYLTFSRQSTYVSIVVSNGALYMQMTTKGTGAILERYITATIKNDGHGASISATTYYRHPPFGASITIRDYEVIHTSSAVTLVNSGVFFNVEMRISGTNGSNISEEEFYKLVYYGIYSVTYNAPYTNSTNYISYDTTNRRLKLYVDASSSAISTGYLRTHWNGDDVTSTEIDPRNWYPVSTYTTFCLVMLFSTSYNMSSSSTFTYEPGSNMYIDISSTWTAGSTSDDSQPNTYGKHIYAQDIRALYNSRPSTVSGYPYLALGIHDSRITAKHLHDYIDTDYYSGSTYSRTLNCGCYIRSYRYTNADGDHFYFTPSRYVRSGGWYDSGTGYIDDDANGIQILTIGTSFKYIYSETGTCGYSATILKKNAQYDYLSLSFRHSSNVESGTGTLFHTSYYVYLDFMDNVGEDYGNIYWGSDYVYCYDGHDLPAGMSYTLVSYQVNTDM